MFPPQLLDADWPNQTMCGPYIPSIQWEMEKYICWILLIAPHNRKWLTGGDQLSTQKFGFLCYRGHWPYRNLDFYATEVIDPYRNLDFYASDLGQKVYKSCGWTQSFSCPATVQGVTPLPSMEESHNMYILHVHCTLYIVHCTCKMYIVHCTCCIHCTLYYWMQHVSYGVYIWWKLYGPMQVLALLV